MTLANCRSCGSVVHLRDGGHGPACCDNADPVEFRATARPLGGAAGGQGGGASAAPSPTSSPKVRHVKVGDCATVFVTSSATLDAYVTALRIDDLCGFVLVWLDHEPLRSWHDQPIHRGLVIRGSFCKALVGYHLRRIERAISEGGAA